MELFRRIKEWAGGLMPIDNSALDVYRDARERSNSSAPEREFQVVKSRPLPLEDRYQIVQDRREVEAVFGRLSARLVDLCDTLSVAARSQAAGRVVLKQIGVTDDARPYLYMKPMSEDGWLIEMGPAGWRISNAEQIVNREMFMRSHADPWDVVTVWRDPQGEGLTRVRSQRFPRELLTTSEYERRVCETLKSFFVSGAQN